MAKYNAESPSAKGSIEETGMVLTIYDVKCGDAHLGGG